MNERLFMKGQRVISAEGEGEVVDAIRDKIVVQLDNGHTQIFKADELLNESNTGFTDHSF